MPAAARRWAAPGAGALPLPLQLALGSGSGSETTALAGPTGPGLPFPTWSPPELADVPAKIGIAIVLDAVNVELAYVPLHGSWLNRIEAQLTPAAPGTHHDSHAERPGRPKVA